jgi:hypothetical protein
MAFGKGITTQPGYIYKGRLEREREREREREALGA